MQVRTINFGFYNNNKIFWDLRNHLKCNNLTIAQNAGFQSDYDDKHEHEKKWGCGQSPRQFFRNTKTRR